MTACWPSGSPPTTRTRSLRQIAPCCRWRTCTGVTVEAAGGTRSVTVTVTDVDEAGTASIDRPQPQVDRLLSARLRDEDDMVDDQRWQWARSQDGRTWTDMEGSTEPQRRPSQADVGMYLRATVTYSDKFGGGKTASAVSANPVEAKTLADSAPSFAGQDDDESTPYIDIARSVDENTAVGMPIGRAPYLHWTPTRTSLFYELLDTPDLEDGSEDGDRRAPVHHRQPHRPDKGRQGAGSGPPASGRMTQPSRSAT